MALISFNCRRISHLFSVPGASNRVTLALERRRQLEKEVENCVLRKTTKAGRMNCNDGKQTQL